MPVSNDGTTQHCNLKTLCLTMRIQQISLLLMMHLLLPIP